MDENGNDIYAVEGKMFSLSNKLELRDLDGSQILNSYKKVLTIFPKYFINNPQGEQLAVIQKKLALRPRFNVNVLGKELTVEGSFFGHSFGIIDNGQEVASIQKKILSFGDTYEIDVVYDDNPELFLFIVIIIDQVIHENKNNQNG